MKIEMTDEKVKHLFRKMRLEDESGCPAFEKLALKYGPATRIHSPAWRLAAAMALIIMLGAGTAVFLVSQPQSGNSSESTYESWAALSNWKATTDNMLGIAGAQIDGTLTTATDALLGEVHGTSNIQ
ncbi:MAG: hypothetical protein WC637_21485 [Victivallales bacterium]|jgi:hypothetical protein